MKPDTRGKLPHVFSFRSHRLRHPSHRMLEAIKRMTRDLAELQAEICSTAGGPAEVLGNFPLRDRDAAQLALGDFRLALDQLRYLLWMSLGDPKHADQIPQGFQDDQPVVGKLPVKDAVALAMTLQETNGSNLPTSASFFDRLDVVIESYMKNNAPAKAGASKSPKS